MSRRSYYRRSPLRPQAGEQQQINKWIEDTRKIERRWTVSVNNATREIEIWEKPVGFPKAQPRIKWDELLTKREAWDKALAEAKGHYVRVRYVMALNATDLGKMGERPEGVRPHRDRDDQTEWEKWVNEVDEDTLRKELKHAQGLSLDNDYRDLGWSSYISSREATIMRLIRKRLS